MPDTLTIRLSFSVFTIMSEMKEFFVMWLVFIFYCLF